MIDRPSRHEYIVNPSSSLFKNGPRMRVQSVNSQFIEDQTIYARCSRTCVCAVSRHSMSYKWVSNSENSSPPAKNPLFHGPFRRNHNRATAHKGASSRIHRLSGKGLSGKVSVKKANSDSRSSRVYPFDRSSCSNCELRAQAPAVVTSSLTIVKVWANAFR
jgi:hypothetical protein